MIAQPFAPGVEHWLAMKPKPLGFHWQPDVPERQPLPLPLDCHEPPWASSAWKVWPRHTVSGCLYVVPLSVHEESPSPAPFVLCATQLPVVRAAFVDVAGLAKAVETGRGRPGIGVGHGALVGAEAARDDVLVGAGAVAVVRVEVVVPVRDHDLAEERALTRREPGRPAPADGAVGRVHPQRDVDARAVDVGHHAGRHLLGALRVAAFGLPLRREADAAREGVVGAVLVLLDERVARGQRAARHVLHDHAAVRRSSCSRRAERRDRRACREAARRCSGRWCC